MAKVIWRVRLLSELRKTYAPKDCIGNCWKDDEGVMWFLPEEPEYYKGDNEEYPFPDGIQLDPTVKWEVIN